MGPPVPGFDGSLDAKTFSGIPANVLAGHGKFVASHRLACGLPSEAAGSRATQSLAPGEEMDGKHGAD
jgi:hypothetical protein